jgi:hypothetical protein
MARAGGFGGVLPTYHGLKEHYNDGRVQVRANPNGNIFVEDIRSGVTIRIHPIPQHEGGLKFSTDSLVEPRPHNGGIAWEVTPRRR